MRTVQHPERAQVVPRVVQLEVRAEAFGHHFGCDAIAVGVGRVAEGGERAALDLGAGLGARR